MLNKITSFVDEARAQLDEMILTLIEDDQVSFHEGESYDSSPSSMPSPQPSKDYSVSHNAFQFVQQFLQDEHAAKKVFMSRRIAHSRFEMTAEQNRQARSLIQAIPQLDQLRFALCPSRMLDNEFWDVLFTLIKESEEGPEQGQRFKPSSKEEAMLLFQQEESTSPERSPSFFKEFLEFALNGDESLQEREGIRETDSDGYSVTSLEDEWTRVSLKKPDVEPNPASPRDDDNLYESYEWI